ncbi:MAG: hypothetical protein N4A35_00350 [Flavobacteriales bacterium]|jgi:uncharacterized membrane protein YheB (UPF0754 family)|nr:hypothetical protein [Flavobacteriales bacterium]
MTEFLDAYGVYLQFLSIPLVSGIVGWGTNVLALKMTFYPLEFWGIKPFLGWQGIIPSKAEKMAKISVNLWTTKLVNVRELFAQLEPAQVAEEMRPQFDRISKEIMDEVMEKQSPDIWRRIPESVKRMTYARISRDMPDVVSEIMTDVKDNIEEVFNIEEMVVQRLTSDKQLMVEMFLNCGKEEFKFIERSGFYFGFLFGIAQMGVWYYFPEWWILPLAGLIVGYATNWLALKLIFEPVEEKSVLGMKFQGLFIKRQNEVAEEYAKMLTEEIFTFDRIFAAIINGSTKDRFVNLVLKHAERGIDEGVGISKPVVNLVAGKRNYDKMKNVVLDKVIREMPSSVKPVFSYADEVMDLETVFRTKMQALSPPEFVGFLRPVFQEDELKLILIGAVLGMAAGFAQLYFVFGG